MKKINSILNPILSIVLRQAFTLGLPMILFILAAYPTQLLAQDADEEAIKSAIKAERDAALSRNAEQWEKLWIHDSKSSRSRLFNSVYSRVKGWENFGPQTLKFFKDNPEPDKTVVKMDSFMISKTSSMAFAEFNSTSTFNDNGAVVTRPSHEYRALIKEKNNWKLVSAISHITTDMVSTPQALENNLNDLGYKYINAKKLNEAIELFKLNIKLYPNAWNPYDSLGEAYALAGNKDLAIQNYQKSVELNPKNENGIAALKKLKGN